jgi:hypothetical protein
MHRVIDAIPGVILLYQIKNLSAPVCLLYQIQYLQVVTIFV